jgi:hypothetical protein
LESWRSSRLPHRKANLPMRLTGPEEHRDGARWPRRDLRRGLVAISPHFRQFLRDTRVFLLIVFALCGWGAHIIDTWLRQAPALVVEMRSDVSSSAQLFYDIGRGINEADSVRLPVTASNAYSLLHLPLPNATIRALRFDPLTGPGTFSVRRAYITDSYGSVNRQFALKDLAASNQIATRTDTRSGVKFSTVPTANDPFVQIALSDPLNPSLSAWKATTRISVQIAASVLVTVLTAAVYFVARRVGGIARELGANERTPCSSTRRVSRFQQALIRVQAFVRLRRGRFETGVARRVCARLVLGCVIALALMVPLSARLGGGLDQYTIAITMQSRNPGHLQVFYDTGEGSYTEARSASVPLQVSDQPHEYRLRLPPGRYRGLRIDPGTREGRYVIREAVILAPDGSVHADIPLARLSYAYQLSVVESSEDRLVVEAAPGSNDPQIYYVLERPVLIRNEVPVNFLAVMTLLWAIATGLVWLVQRVLRGRARLGRMIQAVRVDADTTSAAPRSAEQKASMYPVVLAASWLLQRWLNFWFEPSGPVTLGFCRLLFFGGLFFLYLFEDFSAWARVAPVFWKPIWLVGGWQLPVLDASVLVGLQVVWKTSLALAAVGLLTRAAMAVAFVAGAYLFTLSQNFGQVYHHEPFLILAMGGLALSRAGDAWSLDALAAAYRERSHEGPSPSGEYTWPIRLVWVVVTLVFVAAGISKLRHGGPTWVLSDTMKTLLIRAHYNFSNTDPLVSWGFSLAEWPLAARAMAAAALLLELTFVLALVSRRARWILVPGGIGMLAGFRVFMGVTFGAFLLTNVAFWPSWSTIGRRLATLIPQKKPVTVLFDGACGLCAGAMAVVRRLDLLRRVSLSAALNAKSGK